MYWDVHQYDLRVKSAMNPIMTVPAEQIAEVNDFFLTSDIPGKQKFIFCVKDTAYEFRYGDQTVTITFENGKINCVREDNFLVSRKFDNILAIILEISTSGSLLVRCVASCQNYYCDADVHPPNRPQLCKCKIDRCSKIHPNGRERCAVGWDCKFFSCDKFHPIGRKIDFPGENIPTNPFSSVVQPIRPIQQYNNPFMTQAQINNPFLQKAAPSPQINYAPMPTNVFPPQMIFAPMPINVPQMIWTDTTNHETVLAPPKNILPSTFIVPAPKIDSTCS